MIGRQEARSLAGIDRVSPDPASRYAVSRLFLRLAHAAAPPPHPNVGARRFLLALSQRQQRLWLVLRARSSPHATIRARRSRVSDLSFSGKLPAASVLPASAPHSDSRRSRCYGLSEPVVPLVVRIQRDKEAGGPVRRTQDLHDPRRQHLGFGVQEPFPFQSHLVDNLVFRLQKDTMLAQILCAQRWKSVPSRRLARRRDGPRSLLLDAHGSSSAAGAGNWIRSAVAWCRVAPVKLTR